MKKDHFALKNFLKTKIGNKNHYYYEHPEDKGFKWEGTAWDAADAKRKARDAYETHHGKKGLDEEAAANSVAGGGVAGMTEPVVRKRGKFAGHETFLVKRNTFLNLKDAKRKGKHWRTYLEEDDAYAELREFARRSKGPIVVEDEDTGACMFVRYGNGSMF